MVLRGSHRLRNSPSPSPAFPFILGLLWARPTLFVLVSCALGFWGSFRVLPIFGYRCKTGEAGLRSASYAGLLLPWGPLRPVDGEGVWPATLLACPYTGTSCVQCPPEELRSGRACVRRRVRALASAGTIVSACYVSWHVYYTCISSGTLPYHNVCRHFGSSHILAT